MQALLSFENAPPLAAPLRFFLTAPLFAVLAGLLLIVEGDAMLASRWTPAILAATHLLTLGFMLQVMLGALIQVLPVVAGANLWQPIRVARIVHAGLSLGTLVLAAGFYAGRPAWLAGAAWLLGGTVLFFLAVAIMALRGVPSTSPTIRGLKLALFGLAATVGLGFWLAKALASGWALPFPALVDLHAGWGLGAWGGVLLAALAYVVVPMFQLTPGYPARMSWHFPLAIVGLLLLWSFAVVVGLHSLLQVSQFLVALSGAAFAALTLRLQGLRRRARADATYRYWQLGLLASILAFAMLSTAAVRPGIVDDAAWTPVFGVLLIVGGFLAFISGMLYKIVPFLAWLHLQNCGQAKIPAPAMNKLLPDWSADRQYWAFFLAFALLLLAMFFPALLARLAGAAFCIAFSWLGWNLFLAARRYRQHADLMKEKLANR
jgi:hypothetical protein